MLIDLHRTLARLALLLLGSALSLSAGAQVYKCVDGSGKTAYQSQPCPQASRSVQIDVRSVSSLPALPANGSAADFRQAVASGCVAQGAQSRSGLAHIASEQPRKLRSFCDCTADGALAQLPKLKDLVARNDRAGMERLGFEIGLSCASLLQ